MKVLARGTLALAIKMVPMCTLFVRQLAKMVPTPTDHEDLGEIRNEEWLAAGATRRKNPASTVVT